MCQSIPVPHPYLSPWIGPVIEHTVNVNSRQGERFPFSDNSPLCCSTHTRISSAELREGEEGRREEEAVWGEESSPIKLRVLFSLD